MNAIVRTMTSMIKRLAGFFENVFMCYLFVEGKYLNNSVNSRNSENSGSDNEWNSF
jgi:hypothetical protein